MTITARDIVTKALQKIGALVKNEPPAADEASDGLFALNSLINSWSNDSLVIYARTWETFSLVAGTGSYTMGSSGVFNTTRPTHIVGGYIRSGGIDYPITVVDDSAYNSIGFKTATGIPQFINIDNGYPLATIRLYPYPAAAYQLFLLTEKPLTEFSTLDTVYALPPGTDRALIYNLSLDLAPEYNQNPGPYVVETAKKSLGLIRAKTAQVRGMDAFPQSMRTGNILSGWYY